MNLGQSQWDTVRTSGDCPRLELVSSVPMCFPPRCSSCSWLITPAPSTGESARSAALTGTWAGSSCWVDRLRAQRVLRHTTQTTCGHSIREQFCTHSRVKLVEPKETGHFQSQFPPEPPIFSSILQFWQITLLQNYWRLAYHNLFIACFYSLP